MMSAMARAIVKNIVLDIHKTRCNWDLICPCISNQVFKSTRYRCHIFGVFTCLDFSGVDFVQTLKDPPIISFNTSRYRFLLLLLLMNNECIVSYLVKPINRAFWKMYHKNFRTICKSRNMEKRKTVFFFPQKINPLGKKRPASIWRWRII